MGSMLGSLYFGKIPSVGGHPVEGWLLRYKALFYLASYLKINGISFSGAQQLKGEIRAMKLISCKF